MVNVTGSRYNTSVSLIGKSAQEGQVIPSHNSYLRTVDHYDRGRVLRSGQSYGSKEDNKEQQNLLDRKSTLSIRTKINRHTDLPSTTAEAGVINPRELRYARSSETLEQDSPTAKIIKLINKTDFGDEPQVDSLFVEIRQIKPPKTNSHNDLPSTTTETGVINAQKLRYARSSETLEQDSPTEKIINLIKETDFSDESQVDSLFKEMQAYCDEQRKDVKASIHRTLSNGKNQEREFRDIFTSHLKALVIKLDAVNGIRFETADLYKTAMDDAMNIRGRLKLYDKFVDVIKNEASERIGSIIQAKEYLGKLVKDAVSPSPPPPSPPPSPSPSPSPSPPPSPPPPSSSSSSSPPPPPPSNADTKQWLLNIIDALETDINEEQANTAIKLSEYFHKRETIFNSNLERQLNQKDSFDQFLSFYLKGGESVNAKDFTENGEQLKKVLSSSLDLIIVEQENFRSEEDKLSKVADNSKVLSADILEDLENSTQVKYSEINQNYINILLEGYNRLESIGELLMFIDYIKDQIESVSKKRVAIFGGIKGSDEDNKQSQRLSQHATEDLSESALLTEDLLSPESDPEYLENLSGEDVFSAQSDEDETNISHSRKTRSSDARKKASPTSSLIQYLYKKDLSSESDVDRFLEKLDRYHTHQLNGVRRSIKAVFLSSKEHVSSLRTVLSSGLQEIESRLDALSGVMYENRGEFKVPVSDALNDYKKLKLSIPVSYDIREEGLKEVASIIRGAELIEEAVRKKIDTVNPPTESQKKISFRMSEFNRKLTGLKLKFTNEVSEYFSREEMVFNSRISSKVNNGYGFERLISYYYEGKTDKSLPFVMSSKFKEMENRLQNIVSEHKGEIRSAIELLSEALNKEKNGIKVVPVEAFEIFIKSKQMIFDIYNKKTIQLIVDAYEEEESSGAMEWFEELATVKLNEMRDINRSIDDVINGGYNFTIPLQIAGLYTATPAPTETMDVIEDMSGSADDQRVRNELQGDDRLRRAAEPDDDFFSQDFATSGATSNHKGVLSGIGPFIAAGVTLQSNAFSNIVDYITGSSDGTPEPQPKREPATITADRAGRSPGGSSQIIPPEKHTVKARIDYLGKCTNERSDCVEGSASITLTGNSQKDCDWLLGDRSDNNPKVLSGNATTNGATEHCEYSINTSAISSDKTAGRDTRSAIVDQLRQKSQKSWQNSENYHDKTLPGCVQEPWNSQLKRAMENESREVPVACFSQHFAEVTCDNKGNCDINMPESMTPEYVQQVMNHNAQDGRYQWHQQVANMEALAQGNLELGKLVTSLCTGRPIIPSKTAEEARGIFRTPDNATAMTLLSNSGAIMSGLYREVCEFLANPRMVTSWQAEDILNIAVLSHFQKQDHNIDSDHPEFLKDFMYEVLYSPALNSEHQRVADLFDLNSEGEPVIRGSNSKGRQFFTDGRDGMVPVKGSPQTFIRCMLSVMARQCLQQSAPGAVGSARDDIPGTPSEEEVKEVLPHISVRDLGIIRQAVGLQNEQSGSRTERTDQPARIVKMHSLFQCLPDPIHEISCSDASQPVVEALLLGQRECAEQKFQALLLGQQWEALKALYDEPVRYCPDESRPIIEQTEKELRAPLIFTAGSNVGALNQKLWQLMLYQFDIKHRINDEAIDFMALIQKVHRDNPTTSSDDAWQLARLIREQLPAEECRYQPLLEGDKQSQPLPEPFKRRIYGDKTIESLIGQYKEIKDNVAMQVTALKQREKDATDSVQSNQSQEPDSGNEQLSATEPHDYYKAMDETSALRLIGSVAIEIFGYLNQNVTDNPGAVDVNNENTETARNRSHSGGVDHDLSPGSKPGIHSADLTDLILKLLSQEEEDNKKYRNSFSGSL